MTNKVKKIKQTYFLRKDTPKKFKPFLKSKNPTSYPYHLLSKKYNYHARQRLCAYLERKE